MASSSKKIPIVVMIGGGAKLPAIISASQKLRSKFFITLVVSHKKDSPGIRLALNNKISAVYWNLPDYRERIASGDPKSRGDYMKHLGWFISQPQYRPKLLVFGGWDLVIGENFFSFFKCDFGEGYAAINAHPALLPQEGEKKFIPLPDGTKSPIIKGEQTDVFKTVLAKKLTYFGPTIHFMLPTVYDTGKVIRRKFIKVGNIKTIEDLRTKFMPIEDRIFIQAIDKVIEKYII